MAALSKGAKKLLAYFKLYKITSAQYKAKLPPKAKPHGAFAGYLAELYAGGY